MYKIISSAAAIALVASTLVATPSVEAKRIRDFPAVKDPLKGHTIAAPRPDAATISVAATKDDRSAQDAADQISRRLPNALSSYTVAEIMRVTDEVGAGAAAKEPLVCTIQFRPIIIHCERKASKA